jgi:predicted nucleic acid-binding protein
MPKVTYDSDVFMKRKRTKLPLQGFYMSVVVIEELAAGAQDGSVLDELKAALSNYHKAGHLLVPTKEDWYEAGKVIYLLQQRNKSKKTGDKPKMNPDVRCRMINDVLIARTAKAAGVTVVTYNMRHFEQIQQYCAVKLINAKDYFGK